MSVMPHWSASRFMLYDLCPASFKQRYVDGLAEPPTPALYFGQAVHQGLEAHYNGQDGMRAFRAAWKQFAAELELNQSVTSRHTAAGLRLIDQVFDLDLRGTPERGFSLDTNFELGAPIVGAMDLWSTEDNVVYDFKTTRGAWSQARAQAEVWQPVLYTYAAWTETGQWPAFEYIVLNRSSGSLERFRREWTTDDYVEQLNAAWRRACQISVAVAQGRLDCAGRHGACFECGARWSHDHDCDAVPHSQRIHLTGSA
jgi:hypothetical protein